MNKLLKLVLVFFASVFSYLFGSLELHGQQKYITGIISDTSNQPLIGATISLLNSESLVIAYTSGNKDGSFKLPYSENAFWIKASFVGYKSEQVKIEKSKLVYTIRLVPEAKMLKDVLVRNSPVANLNGDTISYLIRNFSTKEDRTIADVIRRMPGMEVSEDGAIYFNGKKIENLYIDGDDVMDGRYGMATKVIKKELIKSLDVINHHQPINVLKNKVFTDKIAVNLVLQNEKSLKLSATSRLGIGQPSQLDISIAPILLSKKLKMVGLAAFNNAGIDFKNEIKQLGASNSLEDISIQSKTVELSLNSVSPPDIPLNYYYLNRSAIFSINTLYKTKSDIQFKWNSNLFYDRSQFYYQAKTINYLENDTLFIEDKQKIRSSPFLFSTGLNLMANKTHYFLNNALKLSIGKDANTGQIIFNQNQFGQNLNRYYNQFSNDFNWMPAIKNKGIFELRWYSSYGVNRQQLEICKNYYFDISPQNGYYDTVVQRIQSPTWSHNAYLSYKIPSSKIFQEYKVGYKKLEQVLNSSLYLISNAVSFPFVNDAGNNAKFTNEGAYILAHYQIKRQKINADLQLPISSQQIKSKQPLYFFDGKKSNYLFSPNLNLTYSFDNEKFLQSTYQLQNGFGDISTAYNGTILLNYRSLQAFAPLFQQHISHKANISYSHQKSIKLFFSNVGLSFNYLKANTIASDSFSNNLTRTFYIPFFNVQKIVSAYGGLSQYLFGLKAKIGLKFQAQKAIREQLVNNNLLQFQIDNIYTNVSVDKTINKVVNVNYNAGFFWLTMGISGKAGSTLPKSNTFSIDQKIVASYKLFNNIYLETSGTHRINKSSLFSPNGFLFFDANIKRTALMKGLDLVFNSYNILNVKDYRIIQQTKNQIYTNSFQTRGIMFVLQLNYTF